MTLVIAGGAWPDEPGIRLAKPAKKQANLDFTPVNKEKF